MKHFLAKVAFASVTFVFTAFVFANTYEVLYNKDVAFAQSVSRVANQQVINSSIADFSSKIDSGNQEPATPLTGLEQLTIPALQAHVKIEESRRSNNEWYLRPSTLHFVGLNKDKFGTTVDYLLYGTKSWRTLPNPNAIEKGMEVQLYHDKAVSNFVVGEKRLLGFDRSLLVSKSENRQILLVIEDPGSKLYYGFSLTTEGN